MKPLTVPRSRIALVALMSSTAWLAGCASFELEPSIARSNQALAAFTQGELALARTEAQQAQRAQAAARLLGQPLSQDAAVRLALLESPALQALLARHGAEGSATAQAGRISNPVLSLERLRTGQELEIGRSLSFGLLDLLTLPARQRVAEQKLAQQQLKLSAEVLEQVTQIRQAWVRAVAARQLSLYADQVLDSAEVSAELARRMQQVGNFNRLTRARQQAFYADTSTQAASARHQALAAREALTRLLGLNDVQALAMTLPERLPDLPAQAQNPEAVARQASGQRLDVQLARAQFNAAAQAQGLTGITSLIDIELGLIRNTTFDADHRATSRGTELSLRLPLFDSGSLQRQGMSDSTLAAARQLEAISRAAGSHLRESYSAYRTAHDIARHYREEVIPLRKTMADENLLRYNAMLIGVFELLADARDQVGTVMSALQAEQQFWLADAALQASLMGQPVGMALAGPAPSSSAPSPAGH